MWGWRNDPVRSDLDRRRPELARRGRLDRARTRRPWRPFERQAGDLPNLLPGNQGGRRGGQHFTIRPGDILLAEDTAGGGHTWKLVDDQPWRRVYVVLGHGVAVPFKSAK
jgi:hypothetical protein